LQACFRYLDKQHVEDHTLEGGRTMSTAGLSAGLRLILERKRTIAALALILAAACGGHQQAPSGFNDPNTLGQSVQAKWEKGELTTPVSTACHAEQTPGAFLCVVTPPMASVWRGKPMPIEVTVTADGSAWTSSSPMLG
jgi:hypothetical protein